MNKILITGGAGFIGFHLAKRLAKDNQIVILDNLSRGRIDDDFEALLKLNNVDFYNVDLTQKVAYQGLHTDFDYFYHLAAVIGVRNVIEHPDKALLTNAISTLYLFEFAKSQKSLRKIFFSSTSEIYAGTLKHFGLEVPTKESVPLTLDDVRSPRTTYMLSKMYGEAICFSYNLKFGIPFTIGRYHNVYGSRMGYLHVIPEMFYKLRKSKRLEVPSPDHTRAMCYVDDAIEMTVLACESERTHKEILNIGNQDHEIRIIDLAAIIAKVMGVDARLERRPEMAGSPARRCPDISKIKKLTNFSPLIDLETGIRLSFEWYRDKLEQKHE